MEFKELIEIFKKYQKTFMLSVGFFVLLGLITFLFQPMNKKAELTLNVTRSAVQKTSDYRYDDFYRLQADEKFADTVVRWLSNSQFVAQSILREAKISENKKTVFVPERLSSQMIRVQYRVANEADAEKISLAVVKILNEETEKLNKQQQAEEWFLVVGDSPVIFDASISLQKMLLAFFALGVFFGCWIVLLKHYFAK